MDGNSQDNSTLNPLPAVKQKEAPMPLGWKKILFALAPSMAVLLILEVSFRWIYRPLTPPPAVPVASPKTSGFYLAGSREVVFDGPLITKDDLLGFRNVPGVHKISIIFRSPLVNKTWSFRAIIGPDGYRTTSDPSQEEFERPEIWIFGCSMTWGWPLNNSDSFPWILQEKMPLFRVRNLAGNGYGNLHAFLQLRQAIQSGCRAPCLVVFVFNPFHMERNVGASSWLSRGLISGGNSDYGSFRYPRAFWGTLQDLGIEWVSLEGAPIARCDNPFRIEVTRRIFKEIKALCDLIPMRSPVLAYQTGHRNDPVVEYCAEIGYVIADLSVSLVDDHILKPFDSHPNRKAHELYASKLLPVLEELASHVNTNDLSLKKGE